MDVRQGAKTAHDPVHTAASFFKFLVGGAALFIAGCSAFFSVNGLGLLFVGSAAAVMVMAASLELGKLVAASFLYHYWKQISVALRFYLTTAVLLLIGITSLGNYGYLARAYEQTNSQIAMLEQQIQGTQKEIDDTQKQIDGSRADIGKTSDVGRQDIEKLRQQIALATQSLDQSLGRLEDRRKAAKDRRDKDAESVATRLKEAGAILKQSLDSEETAITQLNERIGVLDRAVDAYTSQGGPGFLKSDGVRRGQELREQQATERTAIAAQIDEHHKKQEQLRSEHAQAAATITKELATADEQYKKELAGIDTDAQSLRKASAATTADAETQLKALLAQGQATAQSGGNQIESLYQRIRTGNDEIHRIQAQIAATDIGSYRFVARAFNAGADDVVKWLILVLVLVFDPLAVALTVGFNVALAKDRIARPAKIQEPATTEPTDAEAVLAAAALPESEIQPRPRNRRLAYVAASVGVLLTIAAGGAYYGSGIYRERARTSHAAVIPGESFAVLTVHPAELSVSCGGKKLGDLFKGLAGQPLLDSMSQLLGSGIDRQADVYGFLKFPTGQTVDTTDHQPTMIVGLVMRVTDSRTAETALSRFCDSLSTTLGKTSTEAGGTSHSRSMVRFGRGRYLDPQGSFFSFGLTETEAIVLLELEGNPQHPTVENEMRLCLGDKSTGEGYGKNALKLPKRATEGSGEVALWFDSARCFNHMSKNAAAQVRYTQLQKLLAFDVRLAMRSSGTGQVELAGDYVYSADRFRAGENVTALDLIAKLGPAGSAGVAGRLMDRCAANLDFDGLNETLRTVLGRPRTGADAAQVLVEKSIASDREGKFVLTAHYDNAAGPPIVAALESLAQ